MGIPQEIYNEVNKHTAFAIDTIAKTLAVASQSDADAAGIQRTVARYRRVLAWFGSAANEAGAARVAELCDLLDPHLAGLELRDRPLSKDECRLLTAWPSLVSRYAQAPYDEGARRELIAFLCDPSWETPFTESEAQSILSAVEETVLTDSDLAFEGTGMAHDSRGVLDIAPSPDPIAQTPRPAGAEDASATAAADGPFE
ncbi:MAG: hypothetical protein WBP72_14815, partial [Rhodocyclaceae bacterium]